MMTIEQIYEACETAGVSPSAFWVEAMGGDRAPLPREDVERIIAQLASGEGSDDQ